MDKLQTTSALRPSTDLAIASTSSFFPTSTMAVYVILVLVPSGDLIWANQITLPPNLYKGLGLIAPINRASMDVEVFGGMDHESFELLRLVLEAARIVRRDHGVEVYASPALDLLSAGNVRGIKVGGETIYIEGEPNREEVVEMILEIYRGKRSCSRDFKGGFVSHRREPVSGAGVPVSALLGV